MWYVELAVMGGMILVNAALAAYEIALASITVGRLQVMLRDNRRGAAAALQMKQNIEGSLAVIQLGITLVGAIAAATGGAGAEEDISPALERAGLSPGMAQALGIALVVIPLTAITIVIGELVPKLFALRHKEWVCLKLSPPMKWLALAVWPAVWILEHSASGLMNWAERLWRPTFHADSKSESAELQELRAVANLARTARLIGAREERIILGAARLSTRPVKEIMLPAEHISMLDAGAAISDCLIAAHMDMHTRFPVTERPGDAQGIIGYVNFKDIVAHLKISPHDHSLRGILRQILSVQDSQPISHVLESMMKEHTHIALVRDSGGRVTGLITLEDIVEELIGDIQDEYDMLPWHVAPSGDGWVAGGGVSLTRLRELTGIDLSGNLPEEGIRNLSGWVIAHQQGPVRGGERLEQSGVRLIVRKVRRQRVLEAQISRITPTA